MGKGRRVDMRAVIRSGIACAAAAVALAASVSCGDVAGQGRAPVMHRHRFARGRFGRRSGHAWVDSCCPTSQTLVEQTVNGETVHVPTIFNDVGQATMRIVMKDQGTGGTGVLPSALNAVTLNVIASPIAGPTAATLRESMCRSPSMAA